METPEATLDMDNSGWIMDFGKSSDFHKPPQSRQHFDVDQRWRA
jgi:hypothetical protein